MTDVSESKSVNESKENRDDEHERQIGSECRTLVALIRPKVKAGNRLIMACGRLV